MDEKIELRNERDAKEHNSNEVGYDFREIDGVFSRIAVPKLQLEETDTPESGRSEICKGTDTA